MNDIIESATPVVEYREVLYQAVDAKGLVATVKFPIMEDGDPMLNAKLKVKRDIGGGTAAEMYPKRDLADPESHFGSEVIFDRSGNTMVVAAPARKDVPGTDSVLIYTFTSILKGGYKLHQKLDLPEPDIFTSYGISMAISDSGETLVVSPAPSPMSGTSAAIAVYIYSLDPDSNEYYLGHTLKDTYTVNKAAATNPIAISGDGKVVAVAVPCSSTERAVKVYSNEGLHWRMVGEVVQTEPGSFRRFGSTIALNEDGFTLAVGAPGTESIGQVDSTVGALFVFEASLEAKYELNTLRVMGHLDARKVEFYRARKRLRVSLNEPDEKGRTVLKLKRREDGWGTLAGA